MPFDSPKKVKNLGSRDAFHSAARCSERQVTDYAQRRTRALWPCSRSALRRI